MTNKLEAREIPPAAARRKCEAEVCDPVHRGWREAVTGNVGCMSMASYVINGKQLCKRHASLRALDIAVAQSNGT